MIREIRFRAWHAKEKKMYFRAYQKWFHLLLCDDDAGRDEGRGTPVKRARFGDCHLLESTGVTDVRGVEIYEGDIVEVRHQGRAVTGEVEAVPDMFRSRRLHPLQGLLDRFGLPNESEELAFEVLGNIYEGLHSERPAA